MNEDTEASSRWQPVLVILRDGGRLECACGSLATIVVGHMGQQYNQLESVEHWCQSCYFKAQQEENH